MSVETDPALYKSNYERKEGDRYWTEPWLTSLLLRFLGGRLLDMDGTILEPAAGRGDMSQVFLDYGLDVVASDVDLSEFDWNSCPCFESDFAEALSNLEIKRPDLTRDQVKAVITNPPYGSFPEKFMKHFLAQKDVEVVALLLRSEFNSGKRRMKFFQEGAEFPFAYELVITERPRWDWWFRTEVKESPRHNFSWFVWDRKWEGRSTQYWGGKSA